MKLRNLLPFTLYFSLGLYLISLTPPTEALLFDAGSYYELAQLFVKNGLVSSFFSFAPQFIDRGYPLILALQLKLFGSTSLLPLQLANYLFWALAAFSLYQSFLLLKLKHARIFGYLALFSPLYLTFSAKLYSEPYAALGFSLLLYGVVSVLTHRGRLSYLALVLGGFIFFSTKSVFVLMLIPLFIILRRSRPALLALAATVIILVPGLVSSSRGNRSSYNLTIQSSKLEQTYTENFACIPYYLSYPLGQKLLPSFQGTCHQNNPNPSMPGFADNPYRLAAVKRESGYQLTDWLLSIATHPLKYLLVMLISMSNLVLIEGVYPSTLLLAPTWLMITLYLLVKTVLSGFLWYYAGQSLINLRTRPVLLSILTLPLLYFFVIVGNFPVEQRYFYPLLPYLYFLAALAFNPQWYKSHTHHNS